MPNLTDFITYKQKDYITCANCEHYNPDRNWCDKIQVTVTLLYATSINRCHGFNKIKK